MEMRDRERLGGGVRTPVQVVTAHGGRVQDERSTEGVIRVKDGLELERVKGQKWSIPECRHRSNLLCSKLYLCPNILVHLENNREGS